MRSSPRSKKAETAQAEQKLASLHSALATIEAADEAARQVVLAGRELASDGREISDWAGKAREVLREAQKVMIVAVYDQEKRIDR